jgi:folate-dependent phosphoribosylglycinamide formyltransferase PurN
MREDHKRIIEDMQGKEQQSAQGEVVAKDKLQMFKTQIENQYTEKVHQTESEILNLRS